LLSLLWLMPLLAQKRDVRKIQDRFVAPCCWQESVAVHRSEVAAEMRAEIARMVAEGKREDQIVRIYVERYGERILLEPRGSKLFWLSLVPLAVIAIASAWLLAYVRRKREAPTASTAVAGLPVLPDNDLD
jgi:cytochrome c-type biogenesis protein CcmH